MINITLTDEEGKVVQEVLQQAAENLEREILHTDHPPYKTRLKQRREIVARVLERLPPHAP